MLIAALTIGFDPHLIEIIGRHVDYLHPLNYWLKTSKPLFICIANYWFLLVLAELKARGHERPVTTFKPLAFRLQILCRDCWENLLMVWSLWVLKVTVRVWLLAFHCGPKNVLVSILQLFTYSFCICILESVLLLSPL